MTPEAAAAVQRVLGAITGEDGVPLVELAGDLALLAEASSLVLDQADVPPVTPAEVHDTVSAIVRVHGPGAYLAVCSPEYDDLLVRAQLS